MTEEEFTAGCAWLKNQLPNWTFFRDGFDARLVNHRGPFQIHNRTLQLNFYGHGSPPVVVHTKVLQAGNQVIFGGVPDWLVKTVTKTRH